MKTSQSQTLHFPAADASSIGYIKILRLYLTISASWPYQVGGGRVHPAYWLYGRLVIAWATLAISGEIWFLINNYKILSFYELGHMYLTCFFAILGFVYEKIEQFSYRVVTITMSLAMLCAGAFNLVPVMNNIRSGAYSDPNKTIEFSVFFSYPGFDPQNYYIFVTGWNVFIVSGCAILIGGIDVLMTLFIFQIIGHIEILNNNLENFPKLNKKRKVGKTNESFSLTADMFSDEENIVIGEKIKQCVEHHLLIIRFTDDLSQFFGPVIAVYYLFHLVAGCMMLLELSAGDPGSLTRYGPLTVVIFGQLIIISVIFEIVNTKSEQLANTAYCLPWESMSVSNQRSLCLLLNRLQTPIVVTALGVTPVNVQTMFAILKTSFSYFTFLKTLNQ